MSHLKFYAGCKNSNRLVPVIICYIQLLIFALKQRITTGYQRTLKQIQIIRNRIGKIWRWRWPRLRATFSRLFPLILIEIPLVWVIFFPFVFRHLTSVFTFHQGFKLFINFDSRCYKIGSYSSLFFDFLYSLFMIYLWTSNKAIKSILQIKYSYNSLSKIKFNFYLIWLR